MLRVVLDTNILISACWKPSGLEARTTELAMGSDFRACVSPAVMDEYRNVLRRGKFAKVSECAERLLALFEASAELVYPEVQLAVAADEDDNRLLECALAVEAQYLITGNLRHYPATLGSTRVVNARGFLMACNLLPGDETGGSL